MHTRGLKIAWPTGIYRLKTEHFPGSAAVILKMQIFFFSIPTEAWGIGTQGHEAQGSICSMLSWGEAITAILEVSKCLARVLLEKNTTNANTTSERHPGTGSHKPGRMTPRVAKAPGATLANHDVPTHKTGLKRHPFF